MRIEVEDNYLQDTAQGGCPAALQDTIKGKLPRGNQKEMDGDEDDGDKMELTNSPLSSYPQNTKRKINKKKKLRRAKEGVILTETTGLSDETRPEHR